jgi:hypothetical protein
LNELLRPDRGRRPATILIPPERQDEETEILARLRCGERVEPYETVRRRRDGELVDVSLTVSPVRDGDGRMIGASKIARGISERPRAEERQELLVHELNHRVKNTLAIVQSVAAQSFRSEAERQAYGRFEGRLVALARAHDILTRENWKAPIFGTSSPRRPLRCAWMPAGRRSVGRLVGSPPPWRCLWPLPCMSSARTPPSTEPCPTRTAG